MSKYEENRARLLGEHYEPPTSAQQSDHRGMWQVIVGVALLALVLLNVLVGEPLGAPHAVATLAGVLLVIVGTIRRGQS